MSLFSIFRIFQTDVSNRATVRPFFLPLAAFCVLALGAFGCVPKKTVETVPGKSVQNVPAASSRGSSASGSSAASGASASGTCRFSMGDKQISIPAPSGPQVKVGGEQLRQAVSTWITPSENIFCVYELAAPQKQNSGGSGPTAILRGRQLVIIGALPEFMEESIAGPQFKAIRDDFGRSAGKWRDSAIADFLRMTKNYYKDRPGFTHNMGIYHSTGISVSNVRIIKEMNRRIERKSGALPTGTSGAKSAADGWDFSSLLANPDNDISGTGAVAGSGGALTDKAPDGSARLSKSEVAAEAKKYFASGSYTLSIRNLVYLRGRVFNIYYNAPVGSVEDISRAMEANASYMDSVAASASASLSGTGTERGGKLLNNQPRDDAQDILMPIV